jgi:endonuclease/exonuclease/phosphatase family metal-dependent hydrolase
MKILQLNIWGGKLGKQIIELLLREKPDVVCFQEALQFPGDENLFVTTLEQITAATSFPHSFFSPSFSFKLMKRNAEWGNAIISRTPFLEKQAQFTRGEFTNDFDILDGDYNMRNLQHVLVEVDGKRIHILNHHGHHIMQHKNGDGETMRQCRIIADYVKELEGSVVLTGDFNLSPQSESLQQINNVLVNQCLVNKVKTTRTLLTHKTEVCDFIFTSQDIQVQNFAVFEDIASDHSALSIEIL